MFLDGIQYGFSADEADQAFYLNAAALLFGLETAGLPPGPLTNREPVVLRDDTELDLAA